MPVLESATTIGWKGIDGNVPGHPGYVAVIGGQPTPVTDRDWAIARDNDDIKRRLNTGSLRVKSTLSAAIAAALVPSAEILRIADDAPRRSRSPDRVLTTEASAVSPGTIDNPAAYKAARGNGRIVDVEAPGVDVEASAGPGSTPALVHPAPAHVAPARSEGAASTAPIAEDSPKPRRRRKR